MNELSNDWKEDCLHFWGKVLTGKYCHWCADWDYLSLDETCHPFAYCNCERDEWDMIEKNSIKEELQKEMLKGDINETKTT